MGTTIKNEVLYQNERGQVARKQTSDITYGTASEQHLNYQAYSGPTCVALTREAKDTLGVLAFYSKGKKIKMAVTVEFVLAVLACCERYLNDLTPAEEVAPDAVRES
jgi:hypothetical protein